MPENIGDISNQNAELHTIKMNNQLANVPRVKIDNEDHFHERRAKQAVERVHELPTPPPETSISDTLFQSTSHIRTSIICSSRQTIAVIGVGYIGLELANAFGETHDVVAFDVDQHRLQDIGPGLTNDRIHLTNNPLDIAEATHFLICVPTLLREGSVDASPLRDAIGLVSEYARPGSTVVIESSVAVGMSRRLLKDLLGPKCLKAGMSPERADPGREFPALRDIPKIISAFDDIMPGSLESIKNLYGGVFRHLVPVSSPEVAEMAKLYENCQRMVCIAFANEMADACHSSGIDAGEVSTAAATKPFGYYPYFPGLGVGGHCIPVNPHYLLSNFTLPLLQSATERMSSRPVVLANQMMNRLFCRKISQDSLACDLRVLVVGASFKRGQKSISNSPSVALMKHLRVYWKVDVEFVDPLVPHNALPDISKLDENTRWNVNSLKKEFHAIIVALCQPGLDYEVLKCLEEVLVEDFTFSLDV